MKKNVLLTGGIVLILSVNMLVGCGKEVEESVKKPITIEALEEPIKMQNKESIQEFSESSADTLIEAFLAGEIPANYIAGEGAAFYITDLSMDEEDALSYSVGDRVDLDNDGEKELIINGAYGGIYLDAREDTVYVLAQGEGTSSTLRYIPYEEKNWIVHSDATHAGRIMYDFTLYDGNGQIVDSFNLDKEFWNHPDDPDGPETVYSYRGQQISKAEYEELMMKIFG